MKPCMEPAAGLQHAQHAAGAVQVPTISSTTSSRPLTSSRSTSMYFGFITLTASSCSHEAPTRAFSKGGTQQTVALAAHAAPPQLYAECPPGPAQTQEACLMSGRLAADDVAGHHCCLAWMMLRFALLPLAHTAVHTSAQGAVAAAMLVLAMAY